MLSDLDGHIENAVVEAGYAGIAAVMAIETVFPPIPSELVLPLAGFQVANGTLGFVPALLASTLGAVIGALLLYVIARVGGRRAVLRLHPLLRISERDLDRADGWFDRRAVPIVLFGRLVPGVRSLVSVPAGLSEMPLPTFLAATTAGALHVERGAARRGRAARRAVRPRRGLRRAAQHGGDRARRPSAASPACCGCGAAARARSRRARCPCRAGTPPARGRWP